MPPAWTEPALRIPAGNPHHVVAGNQVCAKPRSEDNNVRHVITRGVGGELFRRFRSGTPSWGLPFADLDIQVADLRRELAWA